MEHLFGYLELDIFKLKRFLIASQTLIYFTLKGFCPISKMSVKEKERFLKSSPASFG